MVYFISPHISLLYQGEQDRENMDKEENAHVIIQSWARVILSMSPRHQKRVVRQKNYQPFRSPLTLELQYSVERGQPWWVNLPLLIVILERVHSHWHYLPHWRDSLAGSLATVSHIHTAPHMTW